MYFLSGLTHKAATLKAPCRARDRIGRCRKGTVSGQMFSFTVREQLRQQARYDVLSETGKVSWCQLNRVLHHVDISVDSTLAASLR